MSLRRVSSAHIEKSGFWVFTTYKFFFTKTRYFVRRRSQYNDLDAARRSNGVARVGHDNDRVLWWTDQGFYWGDPELAAEDVELLLWNRQRRQGSQLERLRKIRERGEDIEASRRERIPDEVKIHVWERDGGQCVRCGADEDLQFDHVIPVAKGGATSAENLQILCGDCNRAKSDSIV